MKTTLLFVLLMGSLLWTSWMHAQTSFLICNYSPIDGIDAPVSDANGVALSGPNYLVELWGGPTRDALTPALNFDAEVPSRTFVGFYDEYPGYYCSYNGFIGIPTVPPLGYAWLEVRAWDTRLGATYEDVAALGMGGYGESPAFYAKGGDPISSLPYPAQPLIGLESFNLRPVPEPSTWALAVLGGLVMWWTQRRQRHY